MRLAEWLKHARDDDGKRLRRYRFAKQIGVSPVMITAYCNGHSWPGREVMERIVVETRGAVTANDFLQIEAAE